MREGYQANRIPGGDRRGITNIEGFVELDRLKVQEDRFVDLLYTFVYPQIREIEDFRVVL